jgi:hypothetical protein
MWLLSVVIRSKYVLPRGKNYLYLQVTFRTQKAFTSINKDLTFYSQLLHPVLRTASDADTDPPFHLAADPDPDPAFYSDADPDPTCHLMRIQLLLLINVIRLSDHWSTDPPLLHFEQARLHCERPWSSIAPF